MFPSRTAAGSALPDGAAAGHGVFSQGAVTAAERALEELTRALESRQFVGWDPYDGLNSLLLRAIARTRLLRGAALQLLRRSPVNLRPLFGVRPESHTKALALLASGYSLPAGVGLEPRDLQAAVRLAEALVARALPLGDGLAWGYEFDVQTRWSYYRRGTPNAVATVFAAHALLDVAGLTGDSRFSVAARASLAFAEQAAIEIDQGAQIFAYLPGSVVPIHNANVLVAGLVARCAESSSAVFEHATAAVRFTLERQRPDGSWPYGEGPQLGWVDGFHTAYVLMNLRRWLDRSPSSDGEEAIRLGAAFYLSKLFDEDGAPRASVESRFPIDIHACSTAIASLIELSDVDDRALATAERVLMWTLREMRRRDGRFGFQRHRWYTNRVPYIRWNDAHMFLALALVVSHGSGR